MAEHTRTARDENEPQPPAVPDVPARFEVPEALANPRTPEEQIARNALDAQERARMALEREAELIARTNAPAGDGARGGPPGGPPAPPVRADQFPFGPPRGFFTVSSTYIAEELQILASTRGLVTTSYTLDASSITADANGDKILFEGTTLQASGGTGKATARTTGACIGVLWNRVNLREGDKEIAMIRGGRLRSDKLTDNGTFGTVAGGAVTDLQNIGVYLTTFDV